MAKKVATILKLQIPAQTNQPQSSVGPALGQAAVNIMDFLMHLTETQSMEKGLPLPVVITVYEDKSFTFEVKSAPASVLIKKAAGISKGVVNRIEKKLGPLPELNWRRLLRQNKRLKCKRYGSGGQNYCRNCKKHGSGS